MTREQYKTLSEKRKKKKKYPKNQYQNIPENGKQKINVYGKQYRKSISEDEKQRKKY